ncbi:hypothetical protein SEA_DALLAS_237 [Mycobacterium phage Dallas]|nr:hypothetical protein AVT17_gp187 [Mycobacterium phage Ariel]AIM50120.1 hypothetical protein PBI_ARIEL_245 [Mycobacterium phage Ariel]ATS93075.1 hypothetical protein SEA_SUPERPHIKIMAN_237 [Mycobacterium phage Superphikiman]QDP43979.1 hypothetical protein SEA_DALLAS_237 [Mycobacterium phage Dallas]
MNGHAAFVNHDSRGYVAHCACGWQGRGTEEEAQWYAARHNRPVCICEPFTGAFTVREPGCRAH